MARILALDYGAKRTGVAVTDEMQIIASPIDTFETEKLFDFLTQYLQSENVSDIVIGLPQKLSGEMNDIEQEIEQFISKFSKRFPDINIHRENEMFTSKMASQALISGGMKKKKRQEKGSLDKISATIILQSFLSRK